MKTADSEIMLTNLGLYTEWTSSYAYIHSSWILCRRQMIIFQTYWSQRSRVVYRPHWHLESPRGHHTQCPRHGCHISPHDLH